MLRDVVAFGNQQDRHVAPDTEGIQLRLALDGPAPCEVTPLPETPECTAALDAR